MMMYSNNARYENLGTELWTARLGFHAKPSDVDRNAWPELGESEQTEATLVGSEPTDG